MKDTSHAQFCSDPRCIEQAALAVVVAAALTAPLAVLRPVAAAVAPRPLLLHPGAAAVARPLLLHPGAEAVAPHENAASSRLRGCTPLCYHLGPTHAVCNNSNCCFSLSANPAPASSTLA